MESLTNPIAIDPAEPQLWLQRPKKEGTHVLKMWNVQESEEKWVGRDVLASSVLYREITCIKLLGEQPFEDLLVWTRQERWKGVRRLG